MKSVLKYIAAAMAVTLGAAAPAQNSNQNVTVHFESTPELRPIDKPAVNPVIEMPSTRLTPLPYSAYQVKVDLPGEVTTLEPAAYADTIYRSPFRGYAALGFMPKYNLGASAGYKILDTDHTRLNGWLQYDGFAYRGTPQQNLSNSVPGPTSPGRPGEGGFADPASPFPSIYMRRNDLTLGLALHQAVGRESFIDAGTDYTFTRYNMPVIDRMANQNVHRYNLSALWTIRHGNLSAGAGAAYGYFGYTNSLGYEELDFAHNTVTGPARPLRESRFSFNGFFEGRFFGSSSAGLKVKVEHLNDGRNGLAAAGADLVYMLPKEHPTLLELTPHYRLDLTDLTLDLGVNVDFTFNGGKLFHISPAALAVWKPSATFKAYLKATGGEWQNSAASLFDAAPYTMPFTAHRYSHIPLEGQLGVVFGSWKGVYAEVAASYSIANDWLMPLRIAEMSTIFAPSDMKGFRFMAAVGYNWRNTVDLSARFEMAPRRNNRGYYQWRDRAREVANIDLRVTPWKPLDITLGWEYRGGRRMNYDRFYPGNAMNGIEGKSDMRVESLGIISNLKAGAVYRITPQWSAFLRGENLLNRKTLLIGGMPGQGITGLVGATYKF